MGTFLAGCAMVVAGGYLLLARVTVTSTGWRFWGVNAFGLSLVPMIIGIGLLFFNGKSLAGWALTAAGALIIVVGIIANMGIYLQPSSLFDTLVVLVLLAGGIGLVARSLKAYSTAA